jgi:hypothetical protein
MHSSDAGTTVASHARLLTASEWQLHKQHNDSLKSEKEGENKVCSGEARDENGITNSADYEDSGRSVGDWSAVRKLLSVGLIQPCQTTRALQLYIMLHLTGTLRL